MNLPVSALWHEELPRDMAQQLADLCAGAADSAQPTPVFFRADDIGRVDANSLRMLALFTEYAMPLCAALVPEWLTKDSWDAIRSQARAEELFCWHQHGFSHVNHETTGKKNEFGEDRSPDAIRRDIRAGKKHLTEILGRPAIPVFTPPWNRCSGQAMQILQEQGFQALSRSINVQPSPPAGLPDLAVNIDLHTRRETDAVLGLDNLMTECRSALASGRMGFMLHHERMNEQAFSFLELLFQAVSNQPGLVACTFRELLTTYRFKRDKNKELQIL